MSNQGPQYPQYTPSNQPPNSGGPPQPRLPDPGQPEYRGRPPAVPKPKKPHVTRNLILVGVGAFVLGLVIGSAGSGASDTAGPAPTVTVTQPAPEVKSTAPPAPATTAPPAPPKATAPTVKDFKLTVKTLTKQCFGSAGCNVTFRILVTYNGPALDPGKSYEVLYQVRGGEDGPLANKLTVEGGESSVDEEEMVSTSKSSAKLTAVVTDVLES